MFKELFVNFTVLATLLFFGNILLNKVNRSRFRDSRWKSWGAGAALGIVGIVLMKFSFPLSDHAVVDLRQTAIIIALYIGGIPAGLTASVVIAIFRMFFFGEFGYSSIIGAGNAMLTFALAASFLRPYKLEPVRWGFAFFVQFSVFLLSFFLVVGVQAFDVVPVYAPIIIGDGVFTFLMLRHLKRSNELFMFMEEAAHKDFLTGLNNPRAFHLLYERRVSLTVKTKERFALILLDIDHFKQINDTYGHPGGDAILRQFGALLPMNTPSNSYCARQGGEEFAIVLDRLNDREIGEVSERIRLAVEEHPFVLDDGRILRLTVSIGYGSSDSGSPKTLFNRVDEALYRAKEKGRNRACGVLELDEQS
ncbi:diguanylate cyclase [Saccharibacillus sp. CPCC 101409]|uniref:GGDEF domain-containing protein n=1 Tax=Saccharibacillus sp. CPCC 101409 TaxID=3058041 RepID=UPI00267125CD|nr:diguanylate cyclase [Saccharibacillus sp. CPCC 101409]MDO3412054.1 diguanylate cyclase [Saccharibacillus sp. CPCC 101409]